MPPQLQQTIEEALAAMLSHPTHELNWRYRRAIYQAFGNMEDKVVKEARGWFAILTAQKVLPIFTGLVPHESMPLQLLATAIEILTNQIERDRALQVLDLGYHSFGNALAWDAFERKVYHNAECAAYSAYKALGEVLDDGDPLKWIHNVSYHKESGIKKLGPPVDDNWVGGEDFTDKELANDGAGDAASAAAVGYACSAESFDCDPSRLKEFWEWWLTGAIPLAWKYATNFEHG